MNSNVVKLVMAVVLVLLLGMARASIFEAGMQFDARVKGIAVNDEIRIKFEDSSKEDSEKIVFLGLCLGRETNNNGQLLQKSEVMKRVRLAMRTGQKVRVKCSSLRIGNASLIERCINHVQIIDADSNVTTAELADKF